ncbi:MAG TPA: hotdog fold thioesterase [Gemmatimonadaceae bacterium]|nr:hotdog fold thioesterase [Gemmatimonadaceae bacterium]
MSAATPDEQALARAVVDKMLAVDGFSRWLGIRLLEIAPGRAVVQMTVRDEMINGFRTAHGGIVFSLADSALAFSTNTGGFISVAMDCTISYPAAVKPGDTLTATSVEESTTNKLAFCSVTVVNQDDVIVGHFRGTVYRTPKRHFPEGTA